MGPRRGALPVLVLAAVLALCPAPLAADTGDASLTPAWTASAQPLGASRARGLGESQARAEASEDDAAPEEGQEGEEEEEEEEKVAPVTITVAVLLLGFLVFDMVLLQLVNWDDPNVRSYIYKMISATLSIFCAVLLNGATFALVLAYLPLILGHGRDKDEAAIGFVEACINAVIGLIIFVSYFSLLNILCYRMRKDKSSTYTVQVIGGHLAAFAGITTFGHLQFVYPESICWAWLVFAGANVFLLACKAISKMTRISFFGEVVLPDHDPASPGGNSHRRRKEEKEANEWRVAISEAEDDAGSIILSFLVVQSIAFTITGNLSHVEGGALQHELWEIRALCVAALGFLVLLTASTFWEAHLDQVEIAEEVQVTPTSVYVRFIDSTQEFFAMSMAWCCLRIAFWSTKHFIKDMELAHVSNAFIVSACAVICVIALDWVADRIQSDMEAFRQWRLKEGYTQMTVKEAVTPRTEAMPMISEAGEEPEVVVERLASIKGVWVDQAGQLYDGSRIEFCERGWSIHKQPEIECKYSFSGEERLELLEEKTGEDTRLFELMSAGPEALTMQWLSGRPLPDEASPAATVKTFSLRRVDTMAPMGRFSPETEQDAEPDDDDDKAYDHTHMEKALRTIINSLGLLVGLGWEKAFHAAGEAITEGFLILEEHKAVSRTMMALLISALVLPGWLRYIVPMSRKTWQDHQSLIDMSKLQRDGRLSNTQETTQMFHALIETMNDKELEQALQKMCRQRPAMTRAVRRAATSFHARSTLSASVPG